MHKNDTTPKPQVKFLTKKIYNKKPNKIVNNNVVSDNVTQEIDLSHLNLKNRNKDLKVQKSLSLKKSTIDRLEKLEKNSKHRLRMLLIKLWENFKIRKQKDFLLIECILY